MKATAIAHPNIALTKYWGRKDAQLNLPNNNSISMNLEELRTTTTVEFSDNYIEDYVEVDGRKIEPKNNGDNKDVYCFLNKFRELYGIKLKAKVTSKNNFPQGTGIASSSSAAAALALASTKAAGLNIDEKEVSRLARLFSGSGCRSVPSGFVEWYGGLNHDDSYAESIAPPEHWQILDIIAVVSNEHKKHGSSEGHMLAKTSPYYCRWQEIAKRYTDCVRKAISEKNFKAFGYFTEQSALSMHAIMVTSDPSLRYWTAGTLEVMDLVDDLRSNGIEAYFTIDAGPNVHIMTLPEYRKKVEAGLNALNIPYVTCKPGGGAKLLEEHLF